MCFLYQSVGVVQGVFDCDSFLFVFSILVNYL